MSEIFVDRGGIVVLTDNRRAIALERVMKDEPILAVQVVPIARESITETVTLDEIALVEKVRCMPVNRPDGWYASGVAGEQPTARRIFKGYVVEIHTFEHYDQAKAFAEGQGSQPLGAR